MSRGARILRFVSGILFIGAAVMTYLAFEPSNITKMIAIIFAVIGISNILLTFVLDRIFRSASDDPDTY
ncbi:MAG: hypothetical protein C4575_07760 [Desulforudis sp.]|nr:hypothetical protein [Clostridia bacterium]MDQ7792457.1 hypothetical protein [Clostridia bacterium]RJX19921.1 MAG: hypothetical protein C4575_07760 [Desulforudis sp.]